MNCPSRTDELEDHPDWNQNPNSLTGDLTTRQDLIGIANLRLQRDHLPSDDANGNEALGTQLEGREREKEEDSSAIVGKDSTSSGPVARKDTIRPTRCQGCLPLLNGSRASMDRLAKTFMKFITFIGPGFMVAVAYIDPGNYATDVAAGAATRFQLLFIVLMSNIFAVVLQSLAMRLGTVTGLNLAEHCRANLPKWMNIALYVLAEAAIIATDIAEVNMSRNWHTLSLFVDLMVLTILGHRFRNCTESVAECSTGCWMCYYAHRRSPYPDFLRPKWLPAASTLFRVFCCPTSLRRSRLLLHPALANRSDHCW